MGSWARDGVILAAACAMAATLASADARADTRSGSALDLLQIESIQPTAGGLKLTLQIEEDELARLGLEALDDYLRANRPQLFSGLSLGLIRYSQPRVVARELRVSARKKQVNTLDVDVRANVVADTEKREFVCELVGWKSACESRWLDRGTVQIATVKAGGELQLSLREGASLRDQPLSAEVFLRRIRGSLTLSALAGVGLEVDLDPPYRAEKVALGLPPAALASLRRFGELVVQDMRIEAAPERRIQITATVARRSPPR